ncbi:hypothetical protein TNCV_3581561 [Trichonephila clavipes]|nr:hypothetical protein TNCV_3581561 [Trichonephila clavipes]
MDNVPGTTADRSSHYNPQLHTRSAYRRVLRLNMNSSYYPGKRIANNDFQQDLFSRNLLFSIIYRKTAQRNLLERNFMQLRHKDYQMAPGRNFEYVSWYKLSIKCFLPL